jgi:hypothetical protein
MGNKVKFLLKNNEFKNKFIELSKKSESIYISVAWVTHNHEAYSVLLKNKHKIKRFFCGVERFLTTPEVLRDFMKEDSFRVTVGFRLTFSEPTPNWS